MHSVLLVDDETHILDSLIQSIPWNEYGISQIYTATDGYQALEIVEQHTIHLLITDIRMPRLGGIELLREVRTISSNTHLVLLSAYSDFEYAKEAIIIGVENYILKPLQLSELEATIKKAIENIKSKKGISDLLFRNNILIRWVTGDIDSEELHERATLLNINFYASNYAVICIQKKEVKDSFSRFSAPCLKELQAGCDTHSFRNENGQFIIILSGRLIDIDTISALFSRQLNLPEYTGKFVLAIGPVVNNSRLVSNSYHVALDLLSINSLYESSPILTSQSATAAALPTPGLTALSALITAPDGRIREREAHSIFNLIVQEDSIEANFANDLIIRECIAIIHGLNRSLLMSTEINQQIFNYRTTFISTITKEQLYVSFLQQLEHGHLLYLEKYERLSPILRLFYRYIIDNYSKGVSIREFCSQNSVSASYLGYLFKEETGCFFNEFLVQYRVNTSKIMLENTNLKVNDIALKVGFCSSSYYVQCFKKLNGLSPTKYRMLAHRENPFS
jgi:Response regulator containing CheY-like receiver domain and AraC-type DNA-binding domain